MVKATTSKFDTEYDFEVGLAVALQKPDQNRKKNDFFDPKILPEKFWGIEK